MSLEDAEALVEEGKTDGVGVSLDSSLGVLCLDFDGRLPDDPIVRRVLRRYGLSYVELSPSGKGCHVWYRTTCGRVSVSQHRKVGGKGVGIFSDRQYITLTGRDLAEDGTRYGLPCLTYLGPAEIERLVEELHPEESSVSVEQVAEPDHEDWVDIDTEAVLASALGAKNGPSHSLLQHGGWSEKYKYVGHAVHALCGRTKHWIWSEYDIEEGDDVLDAVMSLARRSAIYRDVAGDRGEEKTEAMFLRSAKKAKVLKSYYLSIQRYPLDFHLNQLADCLGLSDLDWLGGWFRLGKLVRLSGRDRTTVYRWLAKMKKDDQSELEGKRWRLSSAGLAELEERIRKNQEAAESIIEDGKLVRRDLLRIFRDSERMMGAPPKSTLQHPSPASPQEATSRPLTRFSGTRAQVLPARRSVLPPAQPGEPEALRAKGERTEPGSGLTDPGPLVNKKELLRQLAFPKAWIKHLPIRRRAVIGETIGPTRTARARAKAQGKPGIAALKRAREEALEAFHAGEVLPDDSQVVRVRENRYSLADARQLARERPQAYHRWVESQLTRIRKREKDPVLGDLLIRDDVRRLEERIIEVDQVRASTPAPHSPGPAPAPAPVPTRGSARTREAG